MSKSMKSTPVINPKLVVYEELPMETKQDLEELFRLLRDVELDTLPFMFIENFVDFSLSNIDRFLHFMKLSARIQNNSWNFEICVLSGSGACICRLPIADVKAILKRWPQENGRYLNLEEAETTIPKDVGCHGTEK